MKMVSYAQNFEDVILNRAFAGRTDGFYIDVGACHPLYHSVTKHFYDRGWRGVNIEPVKRVFDVLDAERPRDVNLNVGISNREGTLTFYEAPSSIGRSTLSVASREGWTKYDGCEFVESSIPVMTLAGVCERHADRPIDFLKIDVEGHEREVIQGGDFARWRPRVVMLEGEPDAWGGLLLGAGYLYATCDGINRYYVRDEDRDLIPALDAPVSILDDFVQFEYMQPIDDLKASLAEMQSRYEGSQRELAEAVGDLKAALAEMQSRYEGSQRELAEAAALAGEARSRLGQLEGVGPRTLAMARRLQLMSHRHPGLASLVRRIVRVA